MAEVKRRRKSFNLHLKHLQIPLDNRFSAEISQVIDEVNSRKKLKYKTQERMVESIAYAARAIVEGLYQVYGSRYVDCRLSVPTSKSGYGDKPYQLRGYSHTAVMRVIEALQALGWVDRRKGKKTKDGTTFPTALKAVGGLLEKFDESKFVWRHMALIKQEVIILKGFDPKTKEKRQLPYRDHNQTKRWRKNLQKYNRFLTEHAICLSKDKWGLDQLVKRMASNSYQLDWSFSDNKKKPRIFNFLSVQLRRIFARGSFELGGRFYGGWWQFIPSEARRFITIDGYSTTEVDYAELHPNLMYLEANLPLPEGDLYDLGEAFRGPKYDKNREPYKSKRKVVKTYLNALINDDRGRYRLTPDQVRTININPKEFEQLVFQRHPVLKEIKGKGRGLAFQFLDSQIAEHVMLEMMKKDIVALPVHDSFICQEHNEVILRQVMSQAYEKVFRRLPQLKFSEPPQTDLEPAYYPSGEIDLTYRRNYLKDSPQEIFLSTYDEYLQKKK